MLKNYSAIDLRGIPNKYYEKVIEVVDFGREIPDRKDLGIEFDLNDLNNVKKFKNFLIFTRGGSVKKNRKIIENKNVQILSNPYPVNETVARLASKNNIAFEICVRNIIKVKGFQRSTILKNLKNTVSFAKKFKTKIVITSGARDEFEIKKPRTLIAFGKILGMEYWESKASIYDIPKKILEMYSIEI